MKTKRAQIQSLSHGTGIPLIRELYCAHVGPGHISDQGRTRADNLFTGSLKNHSKMNVARFCGEVIKLFAYVQDACGITFTAYSYVSTNIAY